MLVHFVCTGNTYRSRLAEAYLNSKNLNNIKSFSSGIKADENLSGPITWYASRLLFNYGLIKYMSDIWQKTNKELLEKADFTVFFEKKHYDFCQKNLGFDSLKYEIWNIIDIDVIHKEIGQAEQEQINQTEEAFIIIKQKVNELIEKLQKPSGNEPN